MKTEIIPHKTENLIIPKENEKLKTSLIINYQLEDSQHYSFSYNMNENISMKMGESSRNEKECSFVDAEFEEGVNEKDSSYYLMAAASGVLTGMMSDFKDILVKVRNNEILKKIDYDKIILSAAKLLGYKKNDVRGALQYLTSRILDKTIPNNEVIREQAKNISVKFLDEHPSQAGFIFSLLTQYTGLVYYVDANTIKTRPVQKFYAIGENEADKVIYALLYWFYNMAVAALESKVNIIDDIGLPKDIVKLLKEFSNSRLFKNIPTSKDQCDKLYSQWITKIFSDSVYVDDEGKKDVYSTIEMIKNCAERIADEYIYVLMNECIVRGLYFIKSVCKELKENDISSFENLQQINPQNVLPINNRIVSRMCLIASATFVCVNIAGATAKAIYKKKRENQTFAEVFLSEINIVGVGRFIFACAADCKYWGDDIKIILQRRGKRTRNEEHGADDTILDDISIQEAFEELSLSPEQARLLYSLIGVAVTRDIEMTKDKEQKKTKEEWALSWKKSLLAGMNIESMDYFITDEAKIYEFLYMASKDEEYRKKILLIAMEFILFKPYHSLGIDADRKFKKLKREKYNYIDDQFVRNQTFMSQAEVDEIRDTYKKYKGIISGTTRAKIISAGAMGVATIATGGLAYAFAPGIAAIIAGDAVLGLHGAALTSASLAFVGGGSLAAGGLGMAGGTAIITGGGAILGIAGSGSVSMAAVLQQTGSEYWLRQVTKLMTFNKCVLLGQFGNKDKIIALSKSLDDIIANVERNIAELVEEKNELDKEMIKSANECLKYLKRGKLEFEKMIK